MSADRNKSVCRRVAGSPDGALPSTFYASLPVNFVTVRVGTSVCCHVLLGVYSIPDSPGQKTREQRKGHWVAEGREAPQEEGRVQV